MSQVNPAVGKSLLIVLNSGAQISGALLRTNSQGITVKGDVDGQIVWVPTHSICYVAWEDSNE